jgi:DnaD/phage-associated family protein
MAERRMVSKCISVSEKVNSLPSTFDMLLYTWIIPHADDFGRMPGSPLKVKALVVPMLDKSIKDVEESLSNLDHSGLIIWYEVNGDKFIQVENFDDHQSGLHKRTKSKFPPPPVVSEKFPEIPGNSLLIELNRTELNRTEENGIEKNLLIAIRERFGELTIPDEYAIKAFMNDGMTPELILLAFDRTLKYATNPSIKYAKSILNRWFHMRITTVEQAEEKDPTQKGGVKNERNGKGHSVPYDEFDELSL